jgi:Flp pilus assembly protein TadD
MHSFTFKEDFNMTISLLRASVAASIMALACIGAAQAADTQSTPVANAKIDDFAVGKAAIDAKDWAVAARSFRKVVADNPKNADAHNYLGYASRWMGKYDDAFAAYGQALALDPAHKGALHYSGIAYLKTNQKAQAEAQLARLKAVCASCDETNQLAKAVAEYQTAAK